MGNATPPAVARIYTLSDPRTLEVRYVGMTTKTLAARLRSHLKNYKHERNHRAFWILSLQKAGVAPVIAELEMVPVDERAAAERKWIAFYRMQGARLVNATDGGEGTLGLKMSPEARKKISDSKKGKPQLHLLKYAHMPRSEETRERIRQTLRRGYQEHPEWREAISRVHKGKIISEGHRRIVGAASTRKWEAWRASGATISEESRARMSAAQKERAAKYGPQRPSPEGVARIVESKRQLWAEYRETGEVMTLRARMREGIARSDKRALSGFGTVHVDADGTGHGYSGYKYGCRCDICRGAASAVGKLRTKSDREARRNAPPRSRACQDCNADISHRYPNCKYCETCAARRAEEANERRNEKRRVK
jgi:hypothetical protein